MRCAFRVSFQKRYLSETEHSVPMPMQRRNLAERTMKPFVAAQKSFLFCDTAKGADAGVLCFAMIEMPNQNGLNLLDTYCFYCRSFHSLVKRKRKISLRLVYHYEIIPQTLNLSLNLHGRYFEFWDIVSCPDL